MKCSACGKSVGPLAGGVGFWDLAAQSAPAAPVGAAAEIRGPQAQAGEPRGNHPQPKGPAPKKVSILSIVGVVLLLGLLAMNIKMWADIRKLKQDYEDLRNKPNVLEQMLGNITNNALEEPDPQETTQAPTQTTEVSVPPVEVAPDWICEQPKDRILSKEEIEADKPIPLFELKVDGKDLEFTWEKYDEKDEKWVEVDDRRYEDEDKNTIGGELVILLLEKWSEDVYGEYRCVISDEAGNQVISDSVWLKPAEEK